MKKLPGHMAVIKTMHDLNIKHGDLHLFNEAQVYRLLTKVALLMEGDDYTTWPHGAHKDAKSFVEWIDFDCGNPLAKLEDIE